MKKLFLFLVLAGALPLQSMAQDDDLYFVPDNSAQNTEVKAASKSPTYYPGSRRHVDEYNRAGQYRSYYQKIGKDSVGNDLITFVPGEGVYPDTTYIDTTYVSPDAIEIGRAHV